MFVAFDRESKKKRKRGLIVFLEQITLGIVAGCRPHIGRLKKFKIKVGSTGTVVERPPCHPQV